MLSEPYNFTEDDVDKNRNDLEDNVHEYEEGGLCVLNVNEKKKYRVKYWVKVLIHLYGNKFK